MGIKNKPVLLLHRKSANRPEVKEAVKAVRREGIDLQVRIPWNKKDKAVLVKELLKRGCRRIIAGGGDGTINAVAKTLVGDGSTPPAAALGIMPLGTANDFAVDVIDSGDGNFLVGGMTCDQITLECCEQFIITLLRHKIQMLCSACSCNKKYDLILLDNGLRIDLDTGCSR